MKQKITFLAACVAALLLLGACNSKNVLLKRHYMKGYYAAHTGIKHEPGTVARNKSGRHLAVQHNKPQINPSGDVIARAQPSAAKIEPTNPAAGKQRVSSGKRPSLYSLAPVIPAFKLKQTQTALKALADERDGLSLFWVVILVVLILWAIGYLTGGFGIGNLINLLLVVALVLLILWLLRII